MRLLAPLMLAVTGCYLSHELGGADASAPRDASHDAARPIDAHVGRCDVIAAGPTVLLDHDGVTPRLVPLEGGEVGLAYVDPGSGDPTSVYYERLGADLARDTGPVLVTRSSWTWAEPVRAGASVDLAYGRASDGGGGSELATLDTDGAAAGGTAAVAAEHPDILSVLGPVLLWVAFESHADNAIALALVRPEDGALTSGTVRIATGRYGSQHGVAALPLPDPVALVAYASEGPPGVRRPRMAPFDYRGTLGAEHTLADVDADAITPVVVGTDVYVVWRAPDAIVVTHVDPETLATRDERRVDRLEGALFAGGVEGHLIVGAVQPPALVALDLTAGARVEVPLPLTTWSGASSSTVVPGALVVAAGLTDGPHALPWVVRLECAER